MLINNYSLISQPLVMEASSHVEGNEDAFLKLGEIEVYDKNLKAIITVKTEEFVKVVTDAMFMISKNYKFFYSYLKYSKVFYIPNYPSKMGINTMAVDANKNLWMNVHFIYNTCKMDKNRVFGILFHELMHNFFKHQSREEKIYPSKYRTEEMHMKANICQDFEVNASMVDDGIVPKDFWEKNNGLYNPEYAGYRWEDILNKHGDKEYESWLKRNGIKLSETTKKALEAIQKALKTLRDPDATEAEKEHAGEVLKRKMDELYGKKERKIVDRADLAGLRRELDKLASSRLGDIGDLNAELDEISNDLKKNPKDMDEHEISVTISDIRTLKKDLTEHANSIAETFHKEVDDVIEDIKKSMKSLATALNTLHEGKADPKEERKIIRKAKDDLEDIILNSLDKKKKEENRKKAIEDHKEKLRKAKEDFEKKVKEVKSALEKAEEKREELKKKNPIKKFIDTFKNLRELIRINRISEETYKTFGNMIDVLDKLSETDISDIIKMDVNEVIDLIPELKKNIIEDLLSLNKKRILKISKSDANKFADDVFGALERFFDVLVDEDETNSIKFGAMSLAVEELRKLGKKLKSQKKIKPSKEWIKGFKDTKEELIKILKEKGEVACFDEMVKRGLVKDDDEIRAKLSAK